jgi:hypothetical protein
VPNLPRFPGALRRCHDSQAGCFRCAGQAVVVAHELLAGVAETDGCREVDRVQRPEVQAADRRGSPDDACTDRMEVERLERFPSTAGGVGT